MRRLSGGFRDEAWIAEAAPRLRALTRAILWPSNLATLEGGEMVIRESTHPESRLSFHSSMVGRRVPLLAIALGRAYLAYCPAEECKLLLATLPEGGSARKLLDAVRARGYAVYEGEWMSAGRFGALALPIRAGDRVVACLNIVFSKKAVSTAEAARRYLAQLRETAGWIEQQFNRLSRNEAAR